MAKAVIMPRFGMTQEEATIVRWLVREGDHVSVDDPIAEVTTDKVNMEVPAPADGILGGIRHIEGDTVPVAQVIAYILEKGETAPAIDAEPTAEFVVARPRPARPAAVKASPVARRVATASGLDLTVISGSGPDGRITRRDVESHLTAAPSAPERTAGTRTRATPAARRLARERGIDLARLQGSGPRGRLQASDLLAGEPAARLQGIMPAKDVFLPLEGRRKTIAQRMQASSQQAPHITFDVDVEMTRALAFRETANQHAPEGSAVSMTSLIVKLLAVTLERHPRLNAEVHEDGILLKSVINIGFAAGVEDGLIVPVVTGANRRGLLEVAGIVADLTQRARNSWLLPDDVAGGTFTLTNLGMFGVDRFTAIINPPQVGILAVGRTRTRFVPDAAGSPIARPMMTMTLSVDHRAVDGVEAARFLDDLRAILEEPASIML